jgi:hypothetical protein
MDVWTPFSLLLRLGELTPGGRVVVHEGISLGEREPVIGDSHENESSIARSHPIAPVLCVQSNAHCFWAGIRDLF